MAKELQNQVLVDYHGTGAPVPFRGPVTKTNYDFGGAIQQGYVDERDLPGMLKMKWVKGPYFTLAEEAEAPAEVEETEAPPEDEEIDDADETEEGESDESQESEESEDNAPPGETPAQAKARKMRAAKLKKQAEKEQAEKG